MRGWTIPRIIVYRLMNRQELFHGDTPLCLYAVQSRDIAAQVGISLPLVTPMNTP